MSFFGAIKNAEHSFVAWAEKELTALHNAQPKIEQIADTVLKYAGPALATIVGVEAGPAAAAAVSNIVAQAQSDLTVASALIYDYGATPGATSLVSSVQQNLAGLLSAGHVTDTASVATVTKVSNELGLLVTALSPTPSAPPATGPIQAQGAQA